MTANQKKGNTFTSQGELKVKPSKLPKSAGKHGRPSLDLFYFHLLLVERVARVLWTNQRAKENKSILDYLRLSTENCSLGL